MTPAEIVSQVARRMGIAPSLALAIARQESGLNPRAVGDQGTSYGLFQLHRGGELGGHTAAWAFNPWNNARTALSQVAAVQRLHPGWSPGAIAAGAQRPANPGAYAASINAALGASGRGAGGAAAPYRGPRTGQSAGGNPITGALGAVAGGAGTVAGTVAGAALGATITTAGSAVAGAGAGLLSGVGSFARPYLVPLVVAIVATVAVARELNVRPSMPGRGASSSAPASDADAAPAASAPAPPAAAPAPPPAAPAPAAPTETVQETVTRMLKAGRPPREIDSAIAKHRSAALALAA